MDWLSLFIPFLASFLSSLLTTNTFSFQNVFLSISQLPLSILNPRHPTLLPLPIHSFISFFLPSPNWAALFNSSHLVSFLLTQFVCMIAEWGGRRRNRMIANFKNSDKQIRLALVLIFTYLSLLFFIPSSLIINPCKWIETSVLSFSFSSSKNLFSSFSGSLHTDVQLKLCDSKKWICVFSWHRNLILCLTFFAHLQFYFSRSWHLFQSSSCSYHRHQQRFSPILIAHISNMNQNIAPSLEVKEHKFMVLKTNYSFDWKWHPPCSVLSCIFENE